MAKKRQNKRTTQAVSGRRRPAWFYLSLIAAAGLLLRLIAAAEMAAAGGGRNSVFTPSPLSDLATYMTLAKEVAAGTYTGVFYYQPFYYAVFLPAIRLVAGGSVWAVIFLQALLSAGAVYLAGLIAMHLWSRRAGYWAAGLSAISTPLLLYVPFHQNETLQSFNLALLFFLCLLWLKRGKLFYAAAAGAMLGVSVLTRGNAAFFLPGILAAAIWAECRRAPVWPFRLRRIGLQTGWFLFAYLAVQLPFIIHNTRLEGKLTGPSTAADAVLALGNTPEAPAGGRNPDLPAGPMEYPPAFADFMNRAAAGRPVVKQMCDWLRREPGAFLELQWRKLLLFWDGREIPNNVSLAGEGRASAILSLGLPGRSTLLLALSLAGMFSCGVFAVRKRRIGVLLLYYFVLAYWGATALFYILSRFRAPILPLCFVFGGIFLDRTVRTFRRDRKKLYRTAVPAFLAGLFFSLSAYDFYRENLEAAVLRLLRPDGTRMELIDGRVMRLDSGPYTFGGWEPLRLKPGMVIEKEFPGMPEKTVAELEMTVWHEEPSVLRLQINGTEVRHEGGGSAKALIPVENGRIRLQVLASGVHALLYDRQRRYGRTRVDGEPLAGELVMRLTYPAGE